MMTVRVGVRSVVSNTIVRSRYRRVTWVALWPGRPVAGFVIEEATEDRGAVEPREAHQSIDPHGYQRSAVPIRKERIVGYGGRGHVNSLAMDAQDPIWQRRWVSDQICQLRLEMGYRLLDWHAQRT